MVRLFYIGYLYQWYYLHSYNQYLVHFLCYVLFGYKHFYNYIIRFFAVAAIAIYFPFTFTQRRTVLPVFMRLPRAELTTAVPSFTIVTSCPAFCSLIFIDGTLICLT